MEANPVRKSLRIRRKVFAFFAVSLAAVAFSGLILGGTRVAVIFTGIWAVWQLTFFLAGQWLLKRGLNSIKSASVNIPKSAFRMVSELSELTGERKPPRLNYLNSDNIFIFSLRFPSRERVLFLSSGFFSRLEVKEQEALILRELRLFRTGMPMFNAVVGWNLLVVSTFFRWFLVLLRKTGERKLSVIIRDSSVAVFTALSTSLLSLTFSREAAGLADEFSIRFSGNPGSLCSALRKIGSDQNTTVFELDRIVPFYAALPVSNLNTAGRHFDYLAEQDLTSRLESLQLILPVGHLAGNFRGEQEDAKIFNRYIIKRKDFYDGPHA